MEIERLEQGQYVTKKKKKKSLATDELLSISFCKE